MYSIFWFPFLLLPVVTNAVQSQKPLANLADEWNLDAQPNPNSTGHLVLDTAQVYLRIKAHTIVPGTIPTGTLLYHGRQNPHTPTVHEWVSTGPEFARIFCGELGELRPCWLLTLITTRPLRVLYFDGISAAKMSDGPMDTQDLLAWGAVLPERATVQWEYLRLERLCDVGATQTIDAYDAAEHTACRFTWHDSYPGETRIHLDLTHLISLYDVALAPSLIAGRVGQDRREHRVLGIDKRDTDAVVQRVRELPFSPSTSGIDWSTQFQVIRDRYAKRLEVLQSTLNATDEEDSSQRAFHQLQMLLMPYRLRSAVPPPAGWNNDWAAPVYRVCAQAHTSFIESMKATLTASEQLLLSSAQETTREICRTVVGCWAEGMLELRDSATISSSLALKWKSEVDRLMGWLGWSLSPATSLGRRSLWKDGMARYHAAFDSLSRTLLKAHSPFNPHPGTKVKTPFTLPCNS
ncbi:hypothetical protein DFH09DRAFT_1068876 [Mycena vulgaris]|nr:hypothetical protein DFH09DRAFT_1068876 [Mycena vulgaris]